MAANIRRRPSDDRALGACAVTHPRREIFAGAARVAAGHYRITVGIPALLSLPPSLSFSLFIEFAGHRVMCSLSPLTLPPIDDCTGKA